MSRIWSIFMLSVALSASSVSAAEPPTEAELKARFSERLDELRRLQDAGKVGETSEGYIKAVKGAGGQDVAKLIAAENADRRKLYALIAERTGEPPSEVAKQAAIRNFRKAKPDHWLELRPGTWAQKKTLPEPK